MSSTEEAINLPDLEEMEGQNEGGGQQLLAVGAILDVKKEKNQQWKYLVKWEGFGDEDNTWEWGAHLRRNAVIKDMIEEFRKEHPEKLAQFGKYQRKTRTKKPNWVVIDEPVEPVGDEITQDREMQVDDECFGVKVGSLKGEAKGLIDFTHKTSQTELLLAKMNPGERVTRRRINAFRSTNSPVPSLPSTSQGKKPKIHRAPRKTKNVNKTKNKVKPSEEDIFTTEDDTAMEVEVNEPRPAAPEEEDPQPEKKEEQPKTEEKEQSKAERKEEQPRVETEVALVKAVPKRKQPMDENEPDTQATAEVQKLQRKNPDTPPDLPDFPIITKWVHRQSAPPLSNRRHVSSEEFRLSIEDANEKAVDTIVRQIHPKALAPLLDTHYADNVNWLHMLLQKHKTCDGGHGVDGIVRYVCRFSAGNLLNGQRISDGSTALHLAVQRGQICTLKTLLNYQPNLNLKNKRGQTPLNLAYEKNDAALTKCLLEAGASFHALEVQEASKPSTARKDKAWGVIQTYKLKLAEACRIARNNFLQAASLEDFLVDVTPYMQQSGACSSLFQMDFSLRLFAPPSPEHGYLLFIYVVSNNGEQWKARSWGNFVLLEAPTLNGKKMGHAHDAEWPMVFHAGAHLENGHNRIELKGDIHAWRQECPVIVAHIIMTCQRKQPQQPRLEPVGVAEAAETQQPLEQAPLCGPYM